MAAHDLFRRVDGNPLAINILANFYRNSFLTNEDLKSLYKWQLNVLKPSEDAVSQSSSQPNLQNKARQRNEVRKQSVETIV